MSQKAKGNLRGLSPSQRKAVSRLFERKLDPDEVISFDTARELYQVAESLGRMIGLLISREGRIEEVVVGKRDLLFLPDLGRLRYGKGRLRRLRLVFSDLSKSAQANLPNDILTDLQKLRLDLVAAVKFRDNRSQLSFAHLLPNSAQAGRHVEQQHVPDLGQFSLHFRDFISELEDQLSAEQLSAIVSDQPGAILISVADRPVRESERSMRELAELAKTAGVNVLDQIIQRRRPDPKTLLGKGKLEELVLHSLQLGAEHLIFDCELKPSQWRVITNSTELKVLDRSMLILDIFAQRATSSDGRLQVELAQLRYNLPKLVEKDAGLSRLTGGIGGRGPGETKLEIGRRRIRDKIAKLEKRIDQLSQQRALKRARRNTAEIPLVSILGYTNAGKSTLFNALSKSTVLAEDKLFATLDPAHRRVHVRTGGDGERLFPLVLSDTVGFIRDLPEELKNAFRATLEELYEAQVLIHLLDASEPDIDERFEAVGRILEEMEVENPEQIVVLNKADLLSEEQRSELEQRFEAISISAEQKEGLDKLRTEISEALERQGVDLKLPPEFQQNFVEG